MSYSDDYREYVGVPPAPPVPPATLGDGAWPARYAGGYSVTNSLHAPSGSRQQAAVWGIATLLRGAGHPCNRTGSYDATVEAAVRAYQAEAHAALVIDGVFGWRTARRIIGELCTFYESVYALPGPYLHGYALHEGEWDPGAQGALTPDDIGVMQINLPSHPTVKLVQACDAMFSVQLTVSALAARWEHYSNWGAAIVGHRSPQWADYWVAGAWPTEATRTAAVTYVQGIESGG